MNRNILSILTLAFVLVFVGCSKEEIFDTDQNIKEEAGVIKFGVDSEATRTIYGPQTDGNWPVYWTAGDKIRVFCNAALEATKDTSGNNYADYTVNGDGTASKETIAAVNADAALKWNYGNGHKFFAVYPGNNNNITVGSDGVAKFPINRNQRAIVSTTNGYSQDVVAKADMNNQYMVAYSEKNPADLLDENGNSQTVWLIFKPLMTTLDVVITANSSTSQNSGSVRITGISLASTMITTSSSSKDVFFYDINETNIDNSTIVADPNAKDVAAQTITEQTFVNLVDADGNASYVDLADGHKLTVTIFLPPMSKAAAANLKRQCKVRVHAAGSNELVASIKTNDASSATWTTQLTPSVKKTINLPALPTKAVQDANGNNWITPLDGNIYVSQMSIPGAHDAATGEEMATALGDVFASTQEQPLDKQWTLGVRAFDLRPAIYTKGNNIFGGGTGDDELWLYHGMTRVAISWASAMSTLKAKLTENPGEFAIVLFRHEDEGALAKDSDSDRFNTFMTNYINANKDWIVDWNPNLTIDEARGKIILISRFTGSWSYGCFTGWSHDAEGSTTTIRSADGFKSATMYVQDYYNPSSHDTKWAAIQKYLDVSKTLHTDAAKVNHWCINHASGYVGSSTSSTYINNAAAQNPKLISYITSTTWEGSTGIVLFDYAGASLSNGFFSGDKEVYGDVALQTIIDNNYKYRMKRKGE